MLGPVLVATASDFVAVYQKFFSTNTSQETGMGYSVAWAFKNVFNLDENLPVQALSSFHYVQLSG